MIALIQRVTRAEVRVDGESVGRIGGGMLALVAVERGDTKRQAERLAERLLAYRIFADDEGRMNRSLIDCGGEILLVSQFTLAADTAKGTRPSFTPAADPDAGRAGFETLVAAVRQRWPKVQTGVFGAHMQIELVNDGPVTFWLLAKP